MLFRSAGASLVIALALTANYLVPPEGGALIALWMVPVAASIAVIGWCLWRLRGGPTSHQVARYIEECCPELEDALATAFVHGGRGAGPVAHPSAMAEAVAADAVRRTSGLDLDRIISTRQLRGAGVRAAAATLLLCVEIGRAHV